MSERDDADMLAAEYALGSLDPEEAREAERRLAEDPEFARQVAVWQNRLTPLAVRVPAADPPADLWDRIVASTTWDRIVASTTAAVVPLRRVRIWPATTLGALALAASLAAFMLLRPPEPARVAVLAPIANGTPVLLATAGAGGRLTIRPSGAISVPGDRDLELWALAKGDTQPRSLGVLPVAGRELTISLAPDTQLMVSLEPRGGSPTGQPTGPVLYGGTLTSVN
jgi:anti-sigma-K factor RskA